MIVAAPEVPETIRAFAQQHMSLGSLRYYLAQAVRDAFVTGNGYLLFNTDEPISAYNGHPERAVDLGNGMILATPGEAPRPGLHLRGLEQRGNAYGLGMMEVILPSMMQAQVVGEAAEFARTVLSDERARHYHSWAESTISMAERSAVDIDEAARSVFTPILDFLREPAGDLYFPGRERM
jgi:hypothetical protein